MDAHLRSLITASNPNREDTLVTAVRGALALQGKACRDLLADFQEHAKKYRESWELVRRAHSKLNDLARFEPTEVDATIAEIEVVEGVLREALASFEPLAEVHAGLKSTLGALQDYL